MLKPGDRIMTLTCSGWGNKFGMVWRDPEEGKPVVVHFRDDPTARYFWLSQLAEAPRPMTQAIWNAMPEREQRAYVERRRIEVCTSSGVMDETTYGWGRLDENGYWEYPCHWYGDPEGT